jgi:hypothetical protein
MRPKNARNSLASDSSSAAQRPQTTSLRARCPTLPRKVPLGLQRVIKHEAARRLETRKDESRSGVVPVQSASRYLRPNRINALDKWLTALEACGGDILVQYLLEQVMHRHLGLKDAFFERTDSDRDSKTSKAPEGKAVERGHTGYIPMKVQSTFDAAEIPATLGECEQCE